VTFLESTPDMEMFLGNSYEFDLKDQGSYGEEDFFFSKSRDLPFEDLFDDEIFSMGK
jgi:hypothetical protein